MEQERKIEGNEKALVELAKAQASLNELFGKIGAAQARAEAHRARADNEELSVVLMRQHAQKLTAEKTKHFEALGMPADVQTFATDWDKGVYSWTEPDKPAAKPAE